MKFSQITISTIGVTVALGANPPPPKNCAEWGTPANSRNCPRAFKLIPDARKKTCNAQSCGYQLCCFHPTQLLSQNNYCFEIEWAGDALGNWTIKENTNKKDCTEINLSGSDVG
eukprot:Pgem_evm1s15695